MLFVYRERQPHSLTRHKNPLPEATRKLLPRGASVSRAHHRCATRLINTEAKDERRHRLSDGGNHRQVQNGLLEKYSTYARVISG